MHYELEAQASGLSKVVTTRLRFELVRAEPRPTVFVCKPDVSHFSKWTTSKTGTRKEKPQLS